MSLFPISSIGKDDKKIKEKVVEKTLLLSCGTAGIPVKYHGDEETREEKLAIRGYRSFRHLNSGVKENTEKKGRKKEKKCGVEQKRKKRNGKQKKFARETPWVISGRRFTPRARKKKYPRLLLREIHHISR